MEAHRETRVSEQRDRDSERRLTTLNAQIPPPQMIETKSAHEFCSVYCVRQVLLEYEERLGALPQVLGRYQNRQRR